LDEATEGLAPLIAKEILAIPRLIRLMGMGAIVVDKNLAVVSAIADRIVVFVKGGSPSQEKTTRLQPTASSYISTWAFRF
jgi:ABC-type branched-subunit amino acid transport system ATPase component